MEVDVSVKIEAVDVKLEPLVTDPVSLDLDDRRTEDTRYPDVKLENRPGRPSESDFSVHVIKEELDVSESESTLEVFFKIENDVYRQSDSPLNKMDEYVDIGETEITYPKRPQPGGALNETLLVSQEYKRRKHVPNYFQCNDCDFNSENKNKLRKHVAIHMKGKKTPRLNEYEIKYVKCKICGYKLSHAHSLKRHMKTHTGEKPYECKICNFRCNIRGYIEVHMRTHTGEKPFKCKLCEQSFIQKTTLNKHFRHKHLNTPEIRDKIWNIKCSNCNYRSKDKSHMKAHMRTHTGEKPYQCDICEYSCTQKCSLTKHLRVHSREKPYKCNLCVYKGRSASNLKQHLATHKGKQPFKCEVCDYKTMNKRHLKNHIINHEEDTDVDIM